MKEEKGCLFPPTWENSSIFVSYYDGFMRIKQNI